MKRIKWLNQMVGYGLVLLMVVSCAAPAAPGPTSTAVPPTATSAPPTAAPTASRVPATDTPAAPTPTSAPAATPGSSAEGNALNIEVTTGIAYAKVSIVSSVLDVYASNEPGPWPVVIVAHGVMEYRSNYANLAKSIASQGAVVFNIDWWSTPPWSSGIECIACAVRFARATAADYGGDPSRITLVGSSAGAATGAVVALAGDDFDGNCVVTDASALPNALVAWEGPYDFATTVYSVYDHLRLKDTDPELWEAINPYSHIGQNPELQARLVYGNDVDTSWWDVAPEVSMEFHQALADAGYDVELVLVENADHGDLTTSSSDALAVVVEQVMEVAGSLPPESKSSTSMVVDIDGNVYETVNIGTQWWMAENLKVTRYRDGEPILAISNPADCLGLSTGAHSSYENDPDNIPTYGLLYNWYAVDDGQGLCPDGWHVPSDEEWKQLETYLGMSRSDADNTDGRGTDEGGKLKAVGTGYWQNPNTGASNESGFTALPAGGRACYGIWGGNCYYMGTKASFWTSTEQDEDEAWFRNLDHDKPSIIRKTHDKRVGLSVRCVQD